MSRGFTKRDLKGALQALVDIDPREAGPDGERKCHFCETPEVCAGERAEHDAGCAWAIALLMLTDNPNLAMGIYIGEDIEEAETRLRGEDPDDFDDGDEPQTEEELIEDAARDVRALDASEAKRRVMAELRARPLEGEPVDVDSILEKMPIGAVWED